MSDELHYIDPETGERVVLDITGWQLVITCKDGEIMRCDFPMLVLLTNMRGGTQGAFKHSLLSFDGQPPLLADPDGWWVDMLVEKR